MLIDSSTFAAAYDLCQRVNLWRNYIFNLLPWTEVLFGNTLLVEAILFSFKLKETIKKCLILHMILNNCFRIRFYWKGQPLITWDLKGSWGESLVFNYMNSKKSTIVLKFNVFFPRDSKYTFFWPFLWTKLMLVRERRA